ncbi:beta-lactamase [Anaerospora hongkongensis]|uniref:Beta-lactamase n=1 Tax=Anaerospora hongkongensis TaxID=244830 RepID=A0A4R1Q3P1_9FIRM|nr:serine hydrolase domain-containing protein [Anaerospora hongkongensis]TCL39435.1 beta-lactamase [Anaerospora hongkongensis]
MKAKVLLVFVMIFLIINSVTFAATDLRYIDGIPVVGQETTYKTVDDKVVQFMKIHQIKAASVAIMKDGIIVLNHGYGYSDRKGTIPVEPNTLMRIASVTKPFTAAAVRSLVREGKISLDTKILDVLDIKPFRGTVIDPRWYSITVGNLLSHRGGWDRNSTSVEFDPMFKSAFIQREMQLPGPPNPTQIISYMMSKPLDFNPGEKYVYSNFGYSILGRVIEKVTGMSYFEYLKQSVLIPAGINDIEIGRTLPQDRNPKEIKFYYHPGTMASVINSRIVSPPDGGFYLEAMDSHGALIASSESLVKFAQKFWVSGQPRLEGQSGGHSWWLLGWNT